MGHAEAAGKKRSLSSPSLFRRFSLTSISSTKANQGTLAVRERWASLTSAKRPPPSESVPEEVEQDTAGFLPLIRVVSPLDLFPELPEEGAATRPKHERSTSWSEIVAIFAGGERTRANSDDHSKPKPKFTLGSPSDLDLPQRPDPQAMSSAPNSTAISPVASSSSLASAPPGMTTAPPRPHLVRRDASNNPSRRYTFAMAMTDEHISDETLVQELERIRAVKAWTGNSGGDLEEFWDLGGGSSQSQSPFESTSEGSEQHPQGFFERAPCESPGEQLSLAEPDSDAYMGIALTKPSPQHERRMPCRSSLPAFPVHHRLSNGSNTSPTASSSGPSTSNPTLARVSMLETSDASWHTARRALLTCRECVRTERHYLNGMRTLVSQETASPPPPLMVQYAEHLVEMSERLLSRMEENPNVWGVTTAFLGEETTLEEGFVHWCGKVGTWFEGRSDDVKGKGKQPSRHLQRDTSQEKEKGLVQKTSKGKLADAKAVRKKDRPLPELPTSASTSSSSSSSSASSSSSTSTSTSITTTPATSIASSSCSSKPATPQNAATSPTISLVPVSLLGRKKDKEAMKMTSATSSSQSVDVTRQDSSSSTGSFKSGDGAARTIRKPAVRDLAILPTQRVMRYVLLFKDLLAHTPSTSPARALVERAVNAASRIADKCDQAQNHAAFSLIPPPPPPKDNVASILPRTWTRHMSYSKSREALPSFAASRKSASEHGHASTSTTDVTTTESVSVPPTRAPSSHGEKTGPKVLIKPKRSSSTGAMLGLVPSFTPVSVFKLREHDGETDPNATDCVVIRPSNKLKKRGGAPPPSAFPGQLKAEALIMLP